MASEASRVVVPHDCGGTTRGRWSRTRVAKEPVVEEWHTEIDEDAIAPLTLAYELLELVR